MASPSFFYSPKGVYSEGRNFVSVITRTRQAVVKMISLARGHAPECLVRSKVAYQYPKNRHMRSPG